VTMNEIIERISIAIEASRSCGKEDCERCGEIAKIFGSIEAAEKALDALKAGQALAAHMRWWLCDEHKTEKLAMGDHCLNQDCQYARTALAAYPGGES
jgi:hypothetical protein